MLRPADPGAAVVVCSTCRISAAAREDAAGRRGGALLADALRAVQAEEPDLAGIAVQEMPCLFACQRHCVVQVRAAGKVGYVLGDFVPDREAAHAILTYAVRHAASEEGVVRYAEWPEGVKGHFIVRTPPEGYVCT
jgi:predicted metal-binding protein